MIFYRDLNPRLLAISSERVAKGIVNDVWLRAGDWRDDAVRCQAT